MPHMPTSQRDLLLFQIENAWECLQSGLEGLTAEAASWQSPAYRSEPPKAGWPLPGSIHWHLAHLTHCHTEYQQLILARPRALPEPETVPGSSHAALLSGLSQAHEALRASVCGLVDEDLQDPVGEDQPLFRFITMAICHDTWHASQIALARRLWNTRS